MSDNNAFRETPPMPPTPPGPPMAPPPSSGGKGFTVAWLIRILSIIGVIMFFCPTFLVSCGPEEKAISTLNIVTGIEWQGSSSDPYPGWIVIAIVAIALLILSFVMSSSKNGSIGIMVLALLDIILFGALNVAIKKFALENGMGYKTTVLFGLNILLMIVIIAFAVLSIILKRELDSGFGEFFSGGGPRPPRPGMGPGGPGVPGGGPGPAGPPPLAFCPECGTKNEGTAFCKNCGHKL